LSPQGKRGKRNIKNKVLAHSREGARLSADVKTKGKKRMPQKDKTLKKKKKKTPPPKKNTLPHQAEKTRRRQDVKEVDLTIGRKERDELSIYRKWPL